MVFALVIAFGAIGGAGRASAATQPHIVASPNNVMVNTKISVVGTGFPRRSRLTIEECSVTDWVVPQNPCDTNNTITVVTDRHGRFAHAFTAELCPRTWAAAGPATKRTCYIGNPEPKGVDTITLVGAARITVTYP